jgi:acyl-CoA synthetase (AMP-forming)/AMP-acid ligase II
MRLRQFGIADIIRGGARAFTERPAFLFGEERVSYRQYLERVERLAAGLTAAGVGVGDRVAVVSRNNLEFADLYGAAAWLGAILLPVNWRLSPEEVGYVLADGAPKLLIADAEEQARLAPLVGALPTLTACYGIGGHTPPFRPFAELTVPGRAAPEIAADPEKAYLIIATAAVDGRPRGALLSQANILAAGTQMLCHWRLDEQDIALVALPLFHIAGAGLMLGTLLAGGASRIGVKFEGGNAAATIAADKVTVFSEFAPMLAQLLDGAARGGHDLASLRVVTGLDNAETIDRFEAACPNARFWAGYGQSETTGFATLGLWRDRPGAAGRAALLAEVDVVDEFDRTLPVDAVGEIVVRGPLVFQGYWRREADNALTFRNDWHHTGDMGRFDKDGFLWYAGRSPAKELIKPGGENVYPAEVEAAIRAHEAVAEVAVIGVPDAQWGEAVKAVCVLHPGRALDAAALIDFVGSRIARFKKPKHVVFVESLPRTATGVVDRAKVKEMQGRG